MKVTFLRSEVLELEESAVLVWPHAAKPKVMARAPTRAAALDTRLFFIMMVP